MAERSSYLELPAMVMSIVVGWGCGEELGVDPPQNVTAEVDGSISTVVHVSWNTGESSTGYVEYGSGGALSERTPLETVSATEHSVSLLGLTADTEYDYRVVTWDGDDAAVSERQSVRTGFLPLGLPTISVQGDGHDQLVLAPILGQSTTVTVLNPEGDVVWYHRDERELDFYRARLSRNGRDLIYNAASVSGDPADDSELVRVALDGSGTTATAVPLLAHDFVEHEDGTLAAIVVEFREVDGVELRGDQIVEISPEGDRTTVWSAWDCFDPTEDPGDDIEAGWTFANALDYDRFEDAYYLSMRNFSSIAKIDRASGECEWVLGSFGSTLDFAPGSARFLHQHQFDVVGDHIVVMDNDGSAGTESRIVEYELDLTRNMATEVWQYVSDPSVYTFVLGEPTRLLNGDSFITWSAAGQMERVTSEGERLWRLNTSAGFIFGFHTLTDSLYPDAAAQP